MIIVKLGGSVISNKDEPFSFNEEAVKNIAEEISSFYPEKKFVIVHGGGSYGHPLASKYKLREGMGGIERMIGTSITHQAMLELNGKIMDIFLSKALPAFSVSPSSIFIMKAGKIAYGNIKVIMELVERGFIPVLFGDVCLDEEKGIDILSGDNIISYLEEKMDVEKVIFLMDVDGIYDKNPEEEDANLIENIDEYISIDSSIKKFDVTGGIENKIGEAMNMRCRVYFINGFMRGNLSKAIEGKKVGSIKEADKSYKSHQPL